MDQPMTITADRMLIDGMLFSSWRYYIGRHTIAAAHAPVEMVQLLHDNPNIFSDERRVFAAQDIRDQINTILGFRHNVFIQGHNPNTDAWTLLCRKLAEIAKTTYLKTGEYDKLGQFDPDDYEWTIDLDTCSVTYKDLHKKLVSSIWNDLDDLKPWVKFAGWLDPHVHIELIDKYKDQSGPGFEYATWGRYENEEHVHFKMVYCGCEQYGQRPYNDSYIEPTAIKEIKIV